MFPARCRAPRAPARSARPGACHFPRPRSSRRIPAARTLPWPPPAAPAAGRAAAEDRRTAPAGRSVPSPPPCTGSAAPAPAGALPHAQEHRATGAAHPRARCPRIPAAQLQGRSDTAPARRRSGGSERSRADSGSAGSSQDTSTQRIVPPISTRRCVMRRMRSPQPLTVSVPRCTAIQTRVSVYSRMPP